MTDSIYITFGKDWLDLNGGYKKTIRDMFACHGDNDIFWWWKLSVKPKRDYIWVYIVIGNKVRYRARKLDERGPGYVQFANREVFGKYWMLLIDFEELPKPYEIKKGFQGFRYKYG